MNNMNALTKCTRNRKYFPVYLLFFVSVFLCNPFPITCFGQPAGTVMESRVKAAYIYNFVKFVQWKEQEAEGGPRPTVICVLGSDTIFNLLEGFSKRQSGGSQIIVKENLDEITSASGCHLLFISRSEQQQLSSILKQLEGTDVLTVSDISEFIRYGGMIGFIMVDGRVKIEVNLRAVNKAGLKISAKLLEIARIVP